MRVTPVRVLEFTRQLGFEPEDLTAFVHARCGLHSNIPPCCVAFWLVAYKPWCCWYLEHTHNSRKPVTSLPEKSQGLAFAFVDYADRLRDLDVPRARYIRCPSCLLSGKVNRLKSCNCHLYMLEGSAYLRGLHERALKQWRRKHLESSQA